METITPISLGEEVPGVHQHASNAGDPPLKEEVLSRSFVEPLLHAGIEVLRPTDADFTTRQNSYWSKSARTPTPAYIARPRSAAEVSTIVRTLAAAGGPFAIRSGGHAQYAGASSIAGGVTVDLGRLDWARFDAGAETADLGPGARWGRVYAELARHGRVVAGGRDGDVGVGGFVLGGGYTFFAAARGFACDDVVQFEVVLADGRVVVADATHNNCDLFVALKGGSNNFGVVTNIRMRAIRCEKVWGGLNFFPREVTPDAIDALVHFAGNCHVDEESHLLFFFTYLPNFKSTVIVSAYVQVGGVERASAYDKFLALPAIVDTTKMTTVGEVVSEYDIAPQDNYNTFFTLSVRNDARIVSKASELHDQLVDDLKGFIPDGDFITQCLVQPLPRLYGQKSAMAGGNIMGVESQPVDGLLFVAVVMVKTPEQEAFAYPRVRAWVEALKAFAGTIENGLLPWVYLNYADKTQEVLQSYGPQNVAKMNEVAAKYDPQRVFQKLCPGGFKLPGAG
ncbi:hypothetical protein F5X96DRAFT_613409 [Biscogniauxia mediterranea]|nr:hypothetical protein F5X96DRAFT_613409 [Biscogniauxia mediterranea]